MRTDNIANDQNVLKKILPFNIFYLLCFTTILAVTFIPDVGSFCTETQVYRNIFIMRSIFSRPLPSYICFESGPVYSGFVSIHKKVIYILLLILASLFIN